MIVLQTPNVKPLPRPDTKFPGNSKNPSFDELDAITKKEIALQNAAFEPVLKSAIDKLKTKGYDFTGNTTGVFIADIPFKDLKEIDKWDEVEEMSDGSGKIENFLASARAASGLTAVNSRSMNRSGVTVAQIEAGADENRNNIKDGVRLANNLIWAN